MKERSDPPSERGEDNLFEKIIGFGESSMHKSYYPELMQKIANLKKTEEELLCIKDELEIRVRERTRELEEARAELFEQNRLLEQKVMERTEELLRAKEKAEEANKSKSIFLANMSHELRTPLNGIIGFANLLSSCELNEQQAEYNDIVKNSSMHLLGLINDMLDFSSLEAQKMKLEKRPFDIVDAVKNSKSLVFRQLKSKNLDLKYEIDNRIDPTIIGDQLRFKQILLNLLTNAIKFTPSGTITIRISQVTRNENTVRIAVSVCDEGIGIPEDKIGEIFEMFHQLDESATKRHGGTGLGLSIVKGLVELMGGGITVKSEPGKGSCFTVELPFETRQHFIADITIDKAQDTTSFRPLASGKHDLSILLAEDDEASCLLITEIAKNFNWNITIAHNGAEALEFYKTQVFDAILMDGQMPEMSGFDVTKNIRELERKFGIHTPIIALTAYAMPGDREKFMAFDMDDYITKPVTEESLLHETVMRHVKKD